jgi:hypothetical protein
LLSDRLTIQYGVLLMGGASLATLPWTRGDIFHIFHRVTMRGPRRSCGSSTDGVPKAPAGRSEHVPP